MLICAILATHFVRTFRTVLLLFGQLRLFGQSYVRVEFIQEGLLSRFASNKYPTLPSQLVTTWDSAVMGIVGREKLDKIKATVGDLTDRFANDYLAANPSSSSSKVSDQEEKEGTEWRLAGKSAYSQDIFYNANMIAHPSPNVIKLWIIMRFTDDDKGNTEWRKFVESQKNQPRDYSDYSHTLFLEEYNCSSLQFRLLNATEYDMKGKVLSQVEHQMKWMGAIPGSPAGLILKAACPINQK